MPLIDTVGRRTPKVVGLYAVMYILLVIGGITMVYPFMMMLSSSTTNDVDFREFRIIPRYYYDDTMLFRKFVAEKYTTPNPNLDFVNERYDLVEEKNGKLEGLEFPKIPLPEMKGLNTWNMENDWNEFTAKLPLNYKVSAFRRVGNSTGPVEKRYRRWVEARYRKIEELNRAYITEYHGFEQVRAPQERLWDRIYFFDDSRMQREFTEFKESLSKDEIYYVNGDGPWHTFLLRSRYKKDARDSDNLKYLNTRYKTNFSSFSEIPLAPTYKESTVKDDWKDFVKTKFPVRYLGIDRKAEPMFQEFLKEK
jgi:hypothetical protein